MLARTLHRVHALAWNRALRAVRKGRTWKRAHATLGHFARRAMAFRPQSDGTLVHVPLRRNGLHVGTRLALGHSVRGNEADARSNGASATIGARSQTRRGEADRTDSERPERETRAVRRVRDCTLAKRWPL